MPNMGSMDGINNPDWSNHCFHTPHPRNQCWSLSWVLPCRSQASTTKANIEFGGWGVWKEWLLQSGLFIPSMDSAKGIGNQRGASLRGSLRALQPDCFILPWGFAFACFKVHAMRRYEGLLGNGTHVARCAGA